MMRWLEVLKGDSLSWREAIGLGVILLSIIASLVMLLSIGNIPPCS